MTDLQFEKVQKELREEMKAQGYGWINGRYNKPPVELGYEKRGQELSCISMINSILAYDCKGWTDAEMVMQYEEGQRYNYLADYVDALGRDRVVELIQAQIDDVADVVYAGYVTSSEVQIA